MPAAAVELTATYAAISSIDKDRPFSRESGVQLYPNPVCDHVSIKLNSNGKARIFSIEGKEVMSFELKGGKVETKDLSTLVNGVYLMQINIEGNLYQNKILKHGK